MADQDQETIKSIFKGYKNGIFHFIDQNHYLYEFHGIEDDINEIYQLNNNKYLEECFYVTYETVKETDEFDRDNEMNIIVGLELITSDYSDVD